MPIRALPLISLALTLLFAACTRPPVNYAIGPGDTRPVEYWQIEWVDTEPSQLYYPGMIEDMTERTKYTLEVNARDYVRQIRRQLSRKHDMTFASNFPSYGRIEVSMRGSKLARLVQKQARDPMKDDLDRDLQNPANDPRYYGAGDDSITVDIAVSELLFDSPDWVTFVEVRIYDGQDRLAHQVQIGGETQQEISPKYVASKIAELLAEDKKRTPITE